jgi:NAD(P)-dependent dehydrogenase (short-subunit alcohol dehydrogenase family)
MEKFIHQNKNLFYTGLGFLSLYMMRKYFNGPKSKFHRNFKGKVIVITGGSEGIGKEAAFQLLRDEATVIFACRDEKKTLEIISKIKNEDQRSRAIFIKLDLSDFESIKKFIEEFKSKFEQLDILINNAGAVFKSFSKAKSGIESTLQVNTFGPMILTQGLIDLVNKSNGRIINVSSKGYERMKNMNSLYTDVKEFDTYDFNEQSYSALSQYVLSKLGNIFFTQYLNNYVIKNKLNIKTAALHPGVINTELGREFKGIWTLFKIAMLPFMWLFCKSTRMGAETTLHLCYLPDEEFISGMYYADSNYKTLMPHAQDEKNMDTFMTYSRNLIDLYGKKFDVKLEI